MCKGVNHRLLIVEDDEATAAFLSDNLAADGFAVATASGAAEAIGGGGPPPPLSCSTSRSSTATDWTVDRVRAADGIGSRSTPTCR